MCFETVPFQHRVPLRGVTFFVGVLFEDSGSSEGDEELTDSGAWS